MVSLEHSSEHEDLRTGMGEPPDAITSLPRASALCPPFFGIARWRRKAGRRRTDAAPFFRSWADRQGKGEPHMAQAFTVHTHERHHDLVGRVWVKLNHVAHPQALARERVRRALAGRAAPERIDDALVVVSELVGNAIEHTDNGPLDVSLDLYPEVVVMWVHDEGPGFEPGPPRRAEDLTEHGRGLYLVDLLASRWFVSPTPRGKAVVAVVELEPRTATATA